jgi:hypothetical protein
MLISAKLAPTYAYSDLERFWRLSDELGFYGVWNYDHFYGPDAVGTIARDYRKDGRGSGSRCLMKHCA